jgi:hypothetical protein
VVRMTAGPQPAACFGISRLTLMTDRSALTTGF